MWLATVRPKVDWLIGNPTVRDCHRSHCSKAWMFIQDAKVGVACLHYLHCLSANEMVECCVAHRPTKPSLTGVKSFSEKQQTLTLTSSSLSHLRTKRTGCLRASHHSPTTCSTAVIVDLSHIYIAKGAGEGNFPARNRSPLRPFHGRKKVGKISHSLD